MFTTTERGTIYVNPHLVSAVSHHTDTISRIQFDKDHFILVNDRAEAVTQALEAASSS